jgi:hypothetical protein
MDQKPPDLDANGKPIDNKPPDLDTHGNEVTTDPVADAQKFLDTHPSVSSDDTSVLDKKPEPGILDKGLEFLKSIYEKSNQPLTDLPSKLGEHAASLNIDPVSKMLNRGMGDVLTSLSSPMNLAMIAATGGENLLGGTAAKIAGGIGKTLGIPSAIEGAYNAVTKPTTGGKIGGVVQSLMGALPFLHGAPETNPLVKEGGDILSKDITTSSVKPPVKPKIDTSTGEILNEAPLSPPNEAGIPSFGGRNKVKPDTIKLKAGEGLDKIKEVTAGGYELNGQDPDGSYVFTKSANAPITEGQVADVRPTPANSQLGPQIDTKKGHIISDVLALPRSIMASTDMSAPLRQGLPLIHKKEYWMAIPDLVKAFGSEDAFRAVQDTIANKPLFKPRLGSNGKAIPSFAQEAGLKLTDLHDLSNKEEMLQSSLAERIPLFGKVYRASERSYTAFLNKLRADTFESLINNKNIFSGDGTTNLAGARAIADFVNNATGRGSLNFTLATKSGKTIIPANLEPAAEALGNIFFAPRLMASRMRMLNPAHYIFAPPEVRMERLKSLLAVAAAGNTVGQLGKWMGGDVESDPNSSDYGKVKFGNIHIDPWAGFQQYVVAANRLIRPTSAYAADMANDANTGNVPLDLTRGMLGNPGGHMKSTVTGHDYELGTSPVGSDKSDVLFRFGRYKLNPAVGSALNILLGKDANNQPVNYPEEVVSKFVPIFVQDLKQLATENPNLLPNIDFGNGGIQDKFGGDSYQEFHPENLLAAPLSWFGMGTQMYKPKF